MTLPLPLRSRLAELILDAFREGSARAVLETLIRYCEGHPLMSDALPSRFPVEFFDQHEGRLGLKRAYRRSRDELCERVGRAWLVIKEWPFSEPDLSLGRALEHAAALFDARLDFEVHELLEPFWIAAHGPAREALQGLIQVAVGYHHLANGNLSGARALLEEGSAKLASRHFEGLDLDTFALAVRRSVQIINRLDAEPSRSFDWSLVPKFPRGS